MTLAEFLRDAATTPFAWGKADCCLMACDWIASQRGVDPAASYRGQYDTAHGADRFIAEGGGFLSVTRKSMAAAGLKETTVPQIGDVALVETRQGPALGIVTGTGVACKGPRGLTVARHPILTAWSV